MFVIFYKPSKCGKSIPFKNLNLKLQEVILFVSKTFDIIPTLTELPLSIRISTSSIDYQCFEFNTIMMSLLSYLALLFANYYRFLPLLLAYLYVKCCINTAYHNSKRKELTPLLSSLTRKNPEWGETYPHPSTTINKELQTP